MLYSYYYYYIIIFNSVIISLIITLYKLFFVYANLLFGLSVGTIKVLLLADMTVSVIREEFDDSDTEL